MSAANTVEAEVRNFGMGVKKACIYLGIGRTKFYDLLEDGAFPNAYKCGTTTRVPLGDLLNYRKKNKYTTHKTLATD